MRIERISSSKIKVEIDRVDSKVWGVSLSNINANTSQVQKLYKYALKQAEEKLNFVVGNSKVYIEAIPVESDKFVIIISLDQDKHKEDETDADMIGIYKFYDFEELVSAIKEIYCLFYGKSFIYSVDEILYLVLFPADLFGFYEADNKLSEFSEKVLNQAIFLGMLNEYGKVLFNDNAVETLLKHFNWNIRRFNFRIFFLCV